MVEIGRHVRRVKRKILRISDVMTSTVVTIEIDDTLQTAKDIFDNTYFHHLPVVGDSAVDYRRTSDGKLLGVVSDRDLLKVLSPNIGTAAETLKDLSCLNKKVHQVMTRQLITLESTADIYDAIAIFNRHRVSCIPIVDDSSVIQGILSWRYILKALERMRK
jgi:acetoin utilization protein AcuB